MMTTKKKIKTKALNIEVSTLPNGYSLVVGNKSYMYFDVLGLVKGVFVHVGMRGAEYLPIREVYAMVEATKDGSLVKNLQAKIEELNARIDKLHSDIVKLKRALKEATDN